MLRSASRADEFSQSVGTCWACFLQIQSGCSPLVRRMPTEHMGGESILGTSAVFGIWRRHLVIKLCRREHVTGGSRVIRKCIRDGYPTGPLEIHVPQLFYPICPLLKNACHRVRAGGSLSPNLVVRTSVAGMWVAARRVGYENARRLLGQRLANKLAHNVDTSAFLNRLSENPSDLSSMTGLR